MRILLTVDFYPPFIGGSERQVQILAHELREKGHEVRVGTVWHNGLEETTNEAGVIIHRWKGMSTAVPWFSTHVGRRFHPPFPDPLIVLAMRKVINEFKPDVVNANGWISYSCAAALLGKDIPLIISSREYGHSCATKTMLYEGKLCTGPEFSKCMTCTRKHYGAPKGIVSVLSMYLGKPLLRRKLGGVHSVSSFVKSFADQNLLNGTKISSRVIADILTPSYNEEAVAPKAKQTQTQPIALPDEPFILFVGALQIHKGVRQILEAYQQLKNAPPLVFIGSVWADTPDFPPNVTVIHNAPHDEVMKAWGRCLFGTAPSVWPEPLGGVVREAMLAGKAMIATRIGGNTDMITEGVNGLLVTPGDANSLAEAMQCLIDDPELRERLGVAAHETMKVFTGSYIAPHFEEFYSEVTHIPLNTASAN